MKDRRTPLYRRKYLIDRGFQFSLVALLTFPVFISWIIFFLSYRLVIRPIFTQALGMDESANQSILALQKILERNLDQYFICSLTISTVFVFFLGVVVTNRLAGPIYRLKRYLMGLDSGSFPKFRKHDFFSDLPSLIRDYSEKKKTGSDDSSDPQGK